MGDETLVVPLFISNLTELLLLLLVVVLAIRYSLRV
jgi:hypothetical protein